MKKLTIFIILAILIIGCGISKKSVSIFGMLRMNLNEFNEIKKISIEDEKGFKYIKNKKDRNIFSSISTTTETQTITDEEYEKIKSILKKY